MPIYEYKCQACGHGFEHLHLGCQEGPPQCPACGAPGAQRQLSCFATGGGGGGLPSLGGPAPGGGCGSGGFS